MLYIIPFFLPFAPQNPLFTSILQFNTRALGYPVTVGDASTYTPTDVLSIRTTITKRYICTLYFVLRRIHCFLFDYPYIAWRSMMENPFYDISFFSLQPLHTLLAAASCSFSLSHFIWVLSFLLFVQRVCTALYIYFSPGIGIAICQANVFGTSTAHLFFLVCTKLLRNRAVKKSTSRPLRSRFESLCTCIISSMAIVCIYTQNGGREGWKRLGGSNSITCTKLMLSTKD